MSNYADVLDLPVTGPRLFSTIERRELKWIWPGRIPAGKLTVLAGPPGLGKSLTCISLASMLTNEESKFPDTGDYAPYGCVALLGAEDDDADTVLPRLEAASADTSKIYTFPSMILEEQRGFKLDVDMERLESWVKSIPDLKLLAIDPITSFMGGIDSHKVAEVRGVLHPLSELAQKQGIAVLYITHLNKGQGSVLDKVSGSGAFVAAARSVLFVGQDPADPDRRIIAQPKNNLAPERGGVAYRIRSHGDLPVQEFEPGFVDIDIADLVAPPAHKKSGRFDEAVEWLRAELVGGSDFVNDLKERAKHNDIAEKTLYRAKEKLGVIARKGDGANPSWKWALPGKVAK